MLPNTDKQSEKQNMIVKMAGYLEKKSRMRTKAKFEQEEWLTALLDAKNNNPTLIRPRDQKLSIMEMHYHISKRLTEASRSNSIIVVDHHPRYDGLSKNSDDVFFKTSKKNHHFNTMLKKSYDLRKSESDNRISFYKEIHGLVRTEDITVSSPISDKESCRSRSLSYESIYFKPQEKCLSIEPLKSQSCRELQPKIGNRVSKKFPNKVSKRISRSVSFLQRHSEDSETDDYDYIEENDIEEIYSRPMKRIDESKQMSPELPPRLSQADVETTSISTVAKSEEFSVQEANVDIIYVNNDCKVKMFTSEPDSDSDLVLGYGTEQTVEVEDEPPPLPIKNKSKQDDVYKEKRQYQITGGVCVFENGSEKVIYDVPIPHGKLIEQFRRLTTNPMSTVQRFTDNVNYDDSLEPALYETLHMTPDSLEISSIFPAYKRWSGDSGFQYEDPNFSPARTSFDDSLEPVIAMIHHDRKIWQNVPNINSTDYFR